VTRPAAVGAWVLAGLVVTLSSSDPVAHAVVLAGAWLLLARRRTRERRLRPLALGLAVLFAATVAINGLLAHTGASVIATVPSWVPLVGGTLTAEGFAEGASIGLTLLAAVSVAAALSLVLEPADLVDALPGPLHHSGAAIGAALNLVPATATSFVAVRDAQRLRGWRPKGPRALVDLAVPVVLGAIDRSVQLAESMEARAFGSGPRTAVTGGRRSARSAATVGVSLLAVAVLVAARWHGVTGAWYPYPTPSAPDVSLLALAPAVVVAVSAMLLPPAGD
jgi:energy-coupling factor transport system permease protein